MNVRPGLVMNRRSTGCDTLPEWTPANAGHASPSTGAEEMSAADPAKRERTDRSERNILLTLALLAAAEVCIFAWLFCGTSGP
jgi:hypothetical protein